jgi:TIR domain
MTPAQRIAAIRESATLLAKQEWGDIDLILRQHDLQTSDMWRGDRYNYVLNMLQGGPDDRLHALHQYLVGETGDVPVGAQPWRQGQLKLFMSHLAAQQQFVGEVGAYLNFYGVSSFVAHVSIEPSEEWQSVIETALRSCDAMAVFLHHGFHESFWCDQEVGFAVARRVPVLPIALDVMPYGFMGKLQAARCQPNENSWLVAQKVLQWVIRTPSAQTAMAEGLVTAFERSGSYDNARRVFVMLQDLPAFTPVQLQRLETATKDNDQVRNAVLGPDNIPDLIRKFIIERGGSPASPQTGYSEEPPF